MTPLVEMMIEIVSGSLAPVGPSSVTCSSTDMHKVNVLGSHLAPIFGRVLTSGTDAPRITLRIGVAHNASCPLVMYEAYSAMRSSSIRRFISRLDAFLS